MLPIDDQNPPPQISQLNNNCNNSNKPPRLVDLLPSGEELHKFSIRGYAFSSRSKCLEKSWPFSKKILHSCLSNGLKQILPDFESAELVKKSRRCKKVSVSPEAVLQKDDHGLLVNSDDAGCSLSPPGLVEGGRKESTLSEIDPLPTRKSPGIEAEKSLPEKSVAKPRSTANRKHRLAAKVANLSSKEDNQANSFVVSEAMASSKVCPVCKTFSSSSNTTLNAHIDQCLSGEPAAAWSSPSTSKAVAKEKMTKTKKVRSMADIYENALHCTLEELDRRNGTNWAGSSSLPAQETDRAVAAEPTKQVNSSSPDVEDVPVEGAVYIDEKGTKVRILSKTGDQSSSLPKNAVNREKASKFLKSKKKKPGQLQKRHSKLMKRNKKNFSSRPHRSFSKVDDDEDKNSSAEESSEKEARVTRRFRPREEPSSSRQDMLRGWSGSKRTETPKRGRSREGTKLSGAKRSVFTGEPSFSSPKSSKRTDKPSDESNENLELPLRKRLRRASVDSGKSSHISIGQVKKVNHPKPSAGSTSKNSMASGSGVKSNLKRKAACKKPLVESESESDSDSSEDRMDYVDREVFKGSYGVDGSSSSSSSSSSSDDEEEVAPDQKNLMQFEQTNGDDSSSDTDHDLERLVKELQGAGTQQMEARDPVQKESQHQGTFCSPEVVPGSYFNKVDSIAIPGPPGSFLPSPERMVSEDLAGRSSLTSSRIQSSDDRHEPVDQPTDSPVSALSGVPAPADNGADQTCRCSRNHNGFLLSSSPTPQVQAVSQNFEPESELQRRRTVIVPSRLDSFKSDISSVTDPNPNSPATPSPVIRLMGKDLLIVNNDEAAGSSQVKPTPAQPSQPTPVYSGLVSQPQPLQPSQPTQPGPAYSGLVSQPQPLQPPQFCRDSRWPEFAHRESVNSGRFSLFPPARNTAVNNNNNPPPEVIVIDDTPDENDGVPSPTPAPAPARRPRGMMPTFRPPGSNAGYGYYSSTNPQYDHLHQQQQPASVYSRGFPVNGPNFWMGPSGSAAGNGPNVNLNVNPPPPAPTQWNWPPANPQVRPRYYSYSNFK